MNQKTNHDTLLETPTKDFCSVHNTDCVYWGNVLDEISCPSACECKASWDLLNTWAQRAKKLGLYYQWLKS